VGDEEAGKDHVPHFATRLRRTEGDLRRGGYSGSARRVALTTARRLWFYAFVPDASSAPGELAALRAANSGLCVPRIPSMALSSRGCRPSRRTVMISGHVAAVRFLLVTRTATWLRLSRRGETWQIAESLILRHQLAVLQRRQPCRPGLNWADRVLLATLLGVIPKARRQGLRLLVTPDTMLRWHRDIVRRRWAARSVRGKAGRPATRRSIKTLVLRLARENPGWGTAASTGTGRPGSEDSRLNGSARSTLLPAETATTTGHSRAVPRTKTDSRRWHDQRISPGRVTWMRL
jgi:hypothetical protein